MSIYYLMVKTHNITGLKYLCQTKRKNPHKYLGSGKYWQSHLNKHGKSISTEILKECPNKTYLKYWGIYYSNLWNVVESKKWANLRPEDGDGGRTVFGESHHMKKKEYRTHLKENVWTKEKRTTQSEKSKINNKLRNKENVVAKLKKSWTPERKELLSKRMTNNNPAKLSYVKEKISIKSCRRGPEVIEKISGDNHYKRKLGYIQNQAGKNHPNFNKIVYTFYNKTTLVTEKLTVFELQKKYNLNQGNLSLLLHGKRKSVGGWKLI